MGSVHPDCWEAAKEFVRRKFQSEEYFTAFDIISAAEIEVPDTEARRLWILTHMRALVRSIARHGKIDYVNRGPQVGYKKATTSEDFKFLVEMHRRQLRGHAMSHKKIKKALKALAEAAQMHWNIERGTVDGSESGSGPAEAASA